MSTSTSRVLYSLPKTQPTSNSSTLKQSYTTSSKGISLLQKNQSSFIIPYVSEFSIFSNQKKHKNNQSSSDLYYTHNMRIDYGKLKKIDYGKIQKKVIAKQQKIKIRQQITNQLNIHEEIENNLIKKWNKNQNSPINSLKNSKQNQTMIENKQISVHSLLSLNKNKQQNEVNSQNKYENPQSNRKLIIKNNSKPRKINVTAYDFLNKSTQKYLRIVKQKQNLQQKINSLTNRINTEQNLQSSRKISHSRIIKTINPTSGIQTKMITYPDITQIMKLKDNTKTKKMQKNKWIN